MSEASFLTQCCARALEDLENEDVILEMIDEGAELAELLPSFRYAIEIGGEELVRRFIDAGADPQEPLEELDESALCLAARLEFPAIVGVLLELMPSHDRQALREPLRTAIEHGSHEAAYVLARTMSHEYERRGTQTLALDDPERSAEHAGGFAPLVPVAHHGWDDVARNLIAKGHSPDERARLVDRTTGTVYEDVPAIVAAAMGGHASVVEQLLRAGADASATDAKGKTALQYARERESPAVQQRLDANAKKDAPSVETLIHAARYGDLEGIQRAVEAGVDVDGIGQQGLNERDTALGVATKAGHEAAVVALLRAGADPDHPPRDPPLVQAAGDGHVEITRALLRAGASLQARNDEGYEPLSAAVGANAEATALVMLEAGAQADAIDLEGQTPLSIALAAGMKSVVEALLLYGADPRALDRRGDSILERTDAKPELRVIVQRAADKADAEGRPVFDAHPRRQQLAELKAEMEALDLRPYGRSTVCERLRARLESPGFREAAATLQAELGVEPKPLPEFGLPKRIAGLGFQVPRAVEMVPLVERYADHEALPLAFGERYYLEKTTIALLPTTDPLEAIRAFSPAGPNEDISPNDFFRWALHVHRAHPFRLTALRHDLVEGFFVTDLPDPALMAERVFDICPDAVWQGHMTLESLAESLAERRLFLWWD